MVADLFTPLLPYVAFLLRVWFGATMFYFHGYPKVANFAGMGQLAKRMGGPAWSGYGVATLENVGSILLVVGFLVRLSAALFAIQMIGLIVVRKFKGKAKYHTREGPEYEKEALFLLLSVALLVLGGGAFSVDSFLGL